MYCLVLTILFLCEHQRHNCKSLEKNDLNDKIIYLVLTLDYKYQSQDMNYSKQLYVGKINSKVSPIALFCELYSRVISTKAQIFDIFALDRCVPVAKTQDSDL